jgi:predicted DNA-binding transcriptional regulator AlpA
MPDRILRATEVRQLLGGIAYNTLRSMIARGDFPKPVVITSGLQGVHGWRESDIEAFIASRPFFDWPEKKETTT